MSEGELEYSAAAHPHQMCVDEQLSAGAYRVWGVIDFLKRNRIPPEPRTIADLLDVTKRSVERWIAELQAKHWLIWNKNAPDPWKRYELRHSNSNEEIILAQIRALFAAGGASIEAIADILQNDTDVNSDTDVKTNDSGVVGFDPTIKIDDSGVVGFDRGVISDSRTPHSTAAKRITALHGGGGDSLSSKKISPTPTTKPLPTVSEIWLRGEGVSKKKARLFCDFDIHAVQYEWNESIPAKGSAPEPERQKLIGRLLDRWEIKPPTLPLPPAAPAVQAYVAEEAAEYTQARALLPNGTPLELHYLYLLLEAGIAPDDALARVQSADRAAITSALAAMTYGDAA